jgi:thioredoxin reductase/SAM-dependent methyltransferase
MSAETTWDVVVVGAGAAGLGGALALTRARRSVLVIDAGEPRNAPAEGVHVYPGREGTPPGELLAIGRAEVRGYGGEFRDGTVVSAERLEDGDGDFRVVLADGESVRACRLLVTAGLVDELPDVPGLAELWGTDVPNCPYCHGWEVRDQAIGVLATGPFAVHQALLWRQWSPDITLFLHTGPEPDGEQYEQLAARGIAVVDGKVTALETAGGRLSGVRLADGTVVPCRALTVTPRLTARAGFLAALGLTPTDQEMGGHVIGTRIAADAVGATEVPGVWAAGNVTDLIGQVIGAAAAGTRAGAAVNADLVAEETRRAVAARRAAAGASARPGEQPESAESAGSQSAQSAHPAQPVNAGESAESFWDGLYRASEQVWSGRPNAALVRETDGLSPGRALDLGCGEGADAIWLARQGWRVTAVDVSRVALDRGAGHAADEGVADRVDWQRHDLAVSFPEGTYDLVSTHFLHSYLDLPRERILRTAAASIAPGGVLLIVGHAGRPTWESHDHAHPELPTPQEVLDGLDLPPDEWEVLHTDVHEHPHTGPDGEPATSTNSTVKLRRLR